MVQKPLLPPLDDSFDDGQTSIQAYLAAIEEDGLMPIHALIYDLDLEKLRQDPTFAKAEVQAFAQFQRRFAQEMFDKARYGIEEDIVHQGKVTGQRRRHDSALTLRILETLLPMFQKIDKKEITNRTDHPAGVAIKALENLDDEELAQLRHLLTKDDDKN